MRPSKQVSTVICAALIHAFVLIVGSVSGAWADGPTQIKWLPWTDDIFQSAKSQNKLVILNLEAVWCHWCHVMEKETYGRPAVSDFISKNYLPVKVDQDSRPDLSNRYSEYGWPATIIFNGSGEELEKLSGFQAEQDLLSALKRSVENPVPERSGDPSGALAAERTKTVTANGKTAVLEKLLQRHYESYDPELGGLKLKHKFLDADSVEFSLLKAVEGSEKDREMAIRTLDANLKLIDPVWGGVYQYSTHGVWDRPHFEKVMRSQANNLRVYAIAYANLGLNRYLEASQSIRRYLKSFLSNSDGVFFTSQDADVKRGEHSADYFKLSDTERRKVGMPQVDEHLYSRENGMAVEGLVTLYAMDGDREILKEATRAAEWIVGNRALENGGYRHDEKDPAGPFLGDTLWMGKGFLGLHGVTGERKWLARATAAGDFILAKFLGQGRDTGLWTAMPRLGDAFPPVKQIDENIAAARFLNLLFRYTGKKQYREAAENTLRFLSREEVALERKTEAGILLAEQEISGEPLHVAVVGTKNDPKAAELFQAAVRYPVVYKRVEWIDRGEGPSVNPDIAYPELPRAAAFICSNRRCSLPVFEPEQMSTVIAKFSQTGSGADR